MDDNVKVEKHFNTIAKDYDFWKKKNWYYYARLKEFYRENIPAGKKVLELGCGTGEILHSVQPGLGVGLDISNEMLKLARDKFPGLNFISGSAESPDGIKEKFEYIIMCDLLDHATDVWGIFKNISSLTEKNGRVVITTVNPAWDGIFSILEKVKMKMPEGPHNFLFKADFISLLKLFGYEIEKEGVFLLFPAHIPVISTLINRYIAHLPLIRKFCLVQYVIAKRNKKDAVNRDLSCSVIIPCFNEAENVEECSRRIPKMGRFTEIIFVDDGSRDDTSKTIQKMMLRDSRIKLISYMPNKGKAHALKTGFTAAKGDVLMILDADMAVPPEDLERFFLTISVPGVDFVNGTRMVYPMEKQAMRGLNLFGNKIFSLLFTWLLGQRITDTLCGTKAILNEPYRKMSMSDYDRWGDFDLLLNAARLRLSIVEIPVKYKKRLKGDSKMRPFKHGFQLLVRCLIGFKELKLANFMKKFKKTNLFLLSLLLIFGNIYAQDMEKIYDRGVVYLNRKMYKEAIKEFTRAIQKESGFSRAYNGRGLAYQKRNLLGLAIDDYTKAIEINPRDYEAYCNRGDTYAEKSAFDLAVSDYAKAIEIDNQGSRSYVGRADTYIKQGKYSLAISDYGKALKIDPNLAQAYSSRAVLYFLRNEFGKSWQDVYKAEALGYKIRPEFLYELKKARNKI